MVATEGGSSIVPRDSYVRKTVAAVESRHGSPAAAVGAVCSTGQQQARLAAVVGAEALAFGILVVRWEIPFLVGPQVGKRLHTLA